MSVRFYVGIWCVVLLSLTNFGHTIYINHPDVDFKSLDKLIIAGSYTGISVFKDTEELTQIHQDTSSVISFSNDTLKLAASTNINGDIYDSCILSNSLYFAGNFNLVNGIKVNNIASINLLNTSQIEPLKYGLDGPVYSIYCDTRNAQLFVGGGFIAPVDTMANYSSSLSQFGGSVAVWKNNQWSGLPWKGFDGPVYSIIKKSNSSTLFFGGNFDTTSDGQLNHAPASQPIAISPNGVVGFNTSIDSPDASSIICADETNTNPWILVDNTTGTWQAIFQDFSVNPSLLRLVNSKLDDHQAKEFSVRSLTDSTLFEFTYLDPETSAIRTCSAHCTLSNNPNVTYQDFRFVNSRLSSGIAIDIHSWYGRSGGLSSVKVFQSEIFTYAVRDDPSNQCVTNSRNTHLPEVVTSGTWTASSTTVPYLMSTIVPGEPNLPTITFYPNLVESGTYEIFFYSPPCITIGCTERTFVDIQIQQSPDIKTKVTASEAIIDGIPIYTGYFEVSTLFSPSLTLSLASNITVNEPVSIVAYAVQFVKDASHASLSSTAVYDYGSSENDISWSLLNDMMPFHSSVYTMVSINDSIFIGGNFSGLDQLGLTFSNIVEYNTHSNTIQALRGGGVNGVVNSILTKNEDIYIGGSFSRVLKYNSPSSFNNIARYNEQKSSWYSLNEGVDGPVLSMSWLHDKETILISGNYSHILSSPPTATRGSAYWDTRNQQFEKSSDFPYLTGIVYSVVDHNSTNYFIGDINSAQRYQADDLSFVTSTRSDTLSFFNSFMPQGDQHNIHINTAYVNKTSNSNEMIVLGGQFLLEDNTRNIAIYDGSSNTWEGIQGTSDWTGEVNTLLAVNSDLLFAGGNSTITSLAVFSLKNKTLIQTPSVQPIDSLSGTSVDAIVFIPQENVVIVGGTFSSIDMVSCSSLCSLNIESHQWSALGSGFEGSVLDFQYINETLVVAGNITLNKSPVSVAEYNFTSNTWSSLGDKNDLPGPSQALSYDNITQSIYISGMSGSTAYLCKWNGKQFIELDQKLGEVSVITSLATLPLVNDNSSDPTTKKNILLATGLINLGAYNVSSAFYDESEEEWIPYLLTSNTHEHPNSLSLKGLFYMDEPYLAPTKAKKPPENSTASKEPLPVPLVILVSIAISLGIIFLLVALAMLIAYFKRKRNRSISPKNKPHTYYSGPPASPEAILAMLKVKSPNDEKYATKNHTKPGKEATQTIYNMTNSADQVDRSISSFMIPVASVSGATRQAPSPPTHTYRQSHNYQTLLGPFSRRSASFNNLTATEPKRKTKKRSSTLPAAVNTTQRDSELSSFYNNEYTNRKISESPTSFDTLPSPYRNFEIGVAVKEGNNRSTITTTDMVRGEDLVHSPFTPNSTSPMSAFSGQSESLKWTPKPTGNMSHAASLRENMASRRQSNTNKPYSPLNRSTREALERLPPSNIVQSQHVPIRGPALESSYGHENPSDGFWNDPDIIKFTSQPQNASLSSLAWPQIHEYGQAYTLDGADALEQNNHLKNDSQDELMKINTKMFRLSDTGSVMPIEVRRSPDSSVRWKTAQMGSPIETAYAPEDILLEPSSVAVTSRTGSFIRRQSDLAMNPTPSRTRNDPATREFPKKPVGRAASKRMVEDYMSKKRNNSRAQLKSDFRAIMQSAIANNATRLIATEEYPHLYYAKFDFVAREQGELGFEKGDPIIVVDSSDDIWWMGYKTNKTDNLYVQGVFPSNYVEVAVNIR